MTPSAVLGCSFQNCSAATWITDHFPAVTGWHVPRHGSDPHQTPVNIGLARCHGLKPLAPYPPPPIFHMAADGRASSSKLTRSVGRPHEPRASTGFDLTRPDPVTPSRCGSPASEGTAGVHSRPTGTRDSPDPGRCGRRPDRAPLFERHEPDGRAMCWAGLRMCFGSRISDFNIRFPVPPASVPSRPFVPFVRLGSTLPPSRFAPQWTNPLGHRTGFVQLYMVE